ncbi:hypothetical protein CLCR_04331 [Cladophialophora carrionii]|uniref:Uncharacterized protein n=1 Tax=Cladophialophora carrionii TaxID=86049 RepID=A0A1C1CIQ6_9EURO|nr:hypothetical protein CLCR_04331 [Cladophialophora carrionii]
MAVLVQIQPRDLVDNAASTIDSQARAAQQFQPSLSNLHSVPSLGHIPAVLKFSPSTQRTSHPLIPGRGGAVLRSKPPKAPVFGVLGAASLHVREGDATALVDSSNLAQTTASQDDLFDLATPPDDEIPSAASNNQPPRRSRLTVLTLSAIRPATQSVQGLLSLPSDEPHPPLQSPSLVLHTESRITTHNPFSPVRASLTPLSSLSTLWANDFSKALCLQFLAPLSPLPSENARVQIARPQLRVGLELLSLHG